MPIRERVPLAPLTTLGLGGPARWLAECGTVEEVREALAFARERDAPVFVLGGGSNVVVPDAGYSGLVLRVAIGGVAWSAAEPGVAAAGAGVAWDALVAEAVERGCAGIECLSGIPGTVGGTPIQNVGAYGQEVAGTLAEVACVERATGAETRLGAAECGFGYRTSRFKTRDAGRWVVVGVTFRLAPAGAPAVRYAELERALAARGGVPGGGGAAALRAVREAVLAVRRAKAMVVDPGDPDTRSAGSFFTNPVLPADAYARLAAAWAAAGGGAVPGHPDAGGVKVPAAWLVEQAGFAKGHRRGGAAVSRRHALALVNAGGTAAELLELAEEIRRGVEARFGVRLEREPVVMGAGG